VSTTDNEIAKAVDNTTKFQFASPIKAFKVLMDGNRVVEAIPVFLISTNSANNQIQPQGAVLVTDVASGSAANVEGVGSVTGTNRGLDTNSVMFGFEPDNTTFRAQRFADQVASPAAAASPITVIAAGGAGTFFRLFTATVTLTAAGAATLSDGTTLWLNGFYMAAYTGYTFVFGNNGIKGAGAASALTLAFTGGGNASIVVTYIGPLQVP
jgi:archaellum component FlaG (FlaF/FlaG flagellin family)